MQLLTLLFAISVLFSTAKCSCEDLHNSKYSVVCYEILQSLQEALIQDKGNLYRSKRAFFYAPNADPVLLKVKYNITFAENITEDFLPYCVNEDNSSVSITLNQTKIIWRGWTSRELYLRIDPLLLSHLQVTLPFDILRWIHWPWPGEDLEIASFLWDGSPEHDLSTLLINLHITSLPCIPSKKIFNSTVKQLTSVVSYRN